MTSVEQKKRKKETSPMVAVLLELHATKIEFIKVS